ncbi:helix-turn-helix domain-containing protein [Winogradskya humida]|uniref:Helix-turn-helix protein n=1 Tax=Winogradskya humida TaxID=113566 RepID=A0ABQ3ZFL8_9ACTN|nr:helix-turn-helix transcriptional regulator [Actinoplanes humidus]GIE17322.1 hypothetical protein Ahu01nite_004240 [Actinoplanes humidus]
MTEKTGAGPVADFCFEMGELQRRSGRSSSSLARELNLSRSHLYTIVQGKVRRPPDWSRVVEPFVRACGADREEIIQWRKRHDVLVQVVEQLHRERRRDEQPDPEPAPEPAPVPTPRLTRKLALVTALMVALVAAGGAGAWLSGRDQAKGSPPQGQLKNSPPEGTEGLSIGAAGIRPATSPCVQDAPPGPTDLMEVRHEHPKGYLKANDWWASDGRVNVYPYALHEFVAQVPTGTKHNFNMIVLRGCLPMVAGKHYKLSFTVQSDVAATVRVRVQQPAETATVYFFTRDVRVGPEARSQNFEFTAETTTRLGELQFQVGGQPHDFQLRVSDVTLVG